MKKLSFLAVAMFFAITAYSQTEVSIGVKAGPNFANIDTDASLGANYKNRAGFHGGAFALFKFGNIGIQPELLLSQQGSKVTFNAQDFDANYTYFNIPVILKLYTVAGINIQAGPQFGFLASQKNELLESVNLEDDAKKSDLSLALGLGWDLPLRLSVDARYNLGLSDNSSSPAEVKNQVWQVSVGYKLFNFGK
jgi:hypothetical protein